MSEQHLIEQLMDLRKQHTEALANVHRIEGAQQATRHMLDRAEKAKRQEREECREQSKTDQIQAEADQLREQLRSGKRIPVEASDGCCDQPKDA